MLRRVDTGFGYSFKTVKILADCWLGAALNTGTDEVLLLLLLKLIAGLYVCTEPLITGTRLTIFGLGLMEIWLVSAFCAKTGATLRKLTMQKKHSNPVYNAIFGIHCIQYLQKYKYLIKEIKHLHLKNSI